MIFQKEKQLCFFNPPKNGTHTLRKFLEGLGWQTIKPYKHSYPEELVKRFPNLVNYKIFVFLRNPIERFESFVLYLKQQQPDGFINLLQISNMEKSIEECTYEDVISMFGNLTPEWKNFFAPQSKWMTLPTTEILDFDNFEIELRRVAGVTDLAIPRENATTDWGKSVITDKVRDFVREYYAADYQLARERLGKNW